MKRFLSFFRIVFMSFMLILFIGSVDIVRGDDWKLLGVSSTGKRCYYNVNSVEHKTQDIVQVWIKESVTDEEKNDWIEERKKSGLPVKYWDRVSTRVGLMEMDCKQRRERFIQFTLYRDDGNELISRPPERKGNWTFTVPESIGDILLKKVCNIPVKGNDTPTLTSIDWKLIYESEDGTNYYYNEKSVKHKTKDIVQVLTKESVNDEERNGWIEERKKSGLPFKDWDKMSFYKVSLQEMDCRQRRERWIQVTIYRDDGMVLYSFPSGWKEWTIILPDSIGDLHLREVCNTSKRK